MGKESVTGTGGRDCKVEKSRKRCKPIGKQKRDKKRKVGLLQVKKKKSQQKEPKFTVNSMLLR